MTAANRKQTPIQAINFQFLGGIDTDTIKWKCKPSSKADDRAHPRTGIIQLTGHFPVARWASKSPGNSLSALSMGGPGMAMRLQKPLPLLKVSTLPNCSRIGRPP